MTRSHRISLIVLSVGALLGCPAMGDPPPTGQNITISPAALGSRTWDEDSLDWSVSIHGVIGDNTNQTITITGVPSTGGAYPRVRVIDVTCPGTNINVFLAISNMYSISSLKGNLPDAGSKVIISSCSTHYWIGALGDSEAIYVDRIDDMDIGSDIRGGLRAPDGIDDVSVGSNFFGDIDTDGDLGSLTVGRKFAKNSSLVLATVDIGGSIDYLEAGEIHANISVGSSGGSGDGRVSTIKATKGGGSNYPNYSGDFNGSLFAVDLRKLGPTSERSLIDIEGDLNADLYFEQEIADDNDGDPVIQVLGDLTGQIVINGVDSTYDWEGAIEVGSSTLGPGESGDSEAPYYGVRSTDLGGGAVGLVPFNLHRKDSSPKHGSTVTTGAPTSVQIHHYGPVIDADDDTSTTPPVKVYEASIQVPIGYGQHSTIPVCDTNIWTDVTSGFDIAVSGRVVTISNDTDSFAANHVYQFIPADLVCDVLGSPDVVSLARRGTYAPRL